MSGNLILEVNNIYLKVYKIYFHEILIKFILDIFKLLPSNSKKQLILIYTTHQKFIFENLFCNTELCTINRS